MPVHSGFNGLVQFDCIGTENLKTMIVRDGLKMAVPESTSFAPDTSVHTLFGNLVEFLGKTRSIRFVDIGLTPDVEALQAFWEFASKSMDYRQIWQEFLMLSVDVNNEWSTAISTVTDTRLLAPAEVQPGAPSDAELDETVEGAKKKKHA